MRRYIGSLVAFAFLLLTITALAQTAPSSRQKSSTTTTTTTTTTQTTATGPEHNIEGCIIKESADFFLLPEHGAPFKLQSSQSLAADEGHKVRVSGKETSLNTAAAPGMPASAPSAANAPAASGSGSDLHQLANRELVVDSVKSIANTCPVNWNPGVRR